MKPYIPGKKPVAIYPSGGLAVSIPGESPVEIFKPGLKWLLRDEFTTALAAGSVHGTAAEPGPGTRTVVDTESKLSIASGKLTFVSGKAAPAWGDPMKCYSTPLTRRPGLMVVIQKYSGNYQNSMHGFLGSMDSSLSNGNRFHISGSLQVRNAGLSLIIGSIIKTTNYKYIGSLRATGACFFIKGDVFTYQTLLWIANTDSTTPLYVGIINYDSLELTFDYLRVPTTLWLPAPLLSTTGAMTWPLTNGLGHAEGVAGGLGAGGGGLTMLDMGTWVADGTYVSNTPILGPELATGNLVVDKWYKITASELNYFYTGSVVNDVFRATATTALDANNKVKLVPISGLIANCQLITTDVLAGQVDHAFTLKSQVGWVQADRSFAAKAGATYAVTDTILALTEVTAAIVDTDTITIKHPVLGGVTYGIASVAAYNAAAQTQTITLDAPGLSEIVAIGDKVGIDYASWNGTLTYFDGAGNIKLDEILAGVYTNRGSTATAFSADKRFIVRKVGSEYRVFYNEALVGSAISTVAAGAQVGKYWGLFSTLAANQITSAVIYDTGNVTNAHSVLDKYSKD